MISYFEIEQTLSARGVYFSEAEYHYAIDVILGTPSDAAYAINLETAEYHKVHGTEDEKEFFFKMKHLAEQLEKKQHIVQLFEELRYRHKKLIQDAALNLENIEITSSDVKKVLAAFLRDRIDDPERANVKELVDLLKMYQPYLPDDTSATDFQRHFIQVHEPFNALCTNCNKEMTTCKGLSCTCPHCGARYDWLEDEQRFRPSPDKL